MRIAILGAGAMGMLFSGYLSQKNEVWVIDVDKSRVDKINRDGVLIRESDGSDRCFHVKAVADSSGLNENSLNFFSLTTHWKIGVRSYKKSEIFFYF